MSREIKFRMWDSGNKRMILQGSRGLDKFFNGLSFPLYWGKLMQYTGLKDRNGVEIYEGDIFKYQYETHAAYGIIKFGEIPNAGSSLKHTGFYVEWKNDGENNWNEWWRNDVAFWSEDRNCEVIGNIYDNPDPLGVIP